MKEKGCRWEWGWRISYGQKIFSKPKILFLRQKRIRDCAHFYYAKGEQFRSTKAKQHPAQYSSHSGVWGTSIPCISTRLTSTLTLRHMEMFILTVNSVLQRLHPWIISLLPEEANHPPPPNLSSSRKSQKYCTSPACVGVLPHRWATPDRFTPHRTGWPRKLFTASVWCSHSPAEENTVRFYKCH